MDGIPGVTGSMTATMYSWANSDGSNMTVMFQNGRVEHKAQIGLE